MSFGKKILEKYGYKEGSGLGKNENGITEAIKTKFKFDQKGLGSEKCQEETNNWWERTFNEASNNINIKSENDTKPVQFELKDKDGVEITNKSYSLKKLKHSNFEKNLKYGSFLKAAVLDGKEEEIDGHIKTEDIEIKPIHVPTDEELLKACEYRTAHKGARHGLGLNGKLQRIAEQERALMNQMKQGKTAQEIFKMQPLLSNAKNISKKPLLELNSSKEDKTSEDELPINLESKVKANKYQKKKVKKQLSILSGQIESIGLETNASTTDGNKTIDTNFSNQKSKKSDKKKTEKAIEKITKAQKSKKKNKKNSKKRTLDSEDEIMQEKPISPEYENIESYKKAKKVKLNDSNEVEDENEDTIDKLNESHHSKISLRSLESLSIETPIINIDIKKHKKKKNNNKVSNMFSNDNWDVRSGKKLAKFEKKKLKYKIKQQKLIEQKLRTEAKSKKKHKKEVKKKLESLTNDLDSVEL